MSAKSEQRIWTIAESSVDACFALIEKETLLPRTLAKMKRVDELLPRAEQKTEPDAHLHS